MDNLHAVFAEKLVAAGLVVEGDIQADGQLHRCGTERKPKGKDGTYKAFLDEPATIWWCNWQTGDTGTWTCIASKEMTEAQRKALRCRIQKIQAEANAERQRRYAVATQRAKEIWNRAAKAADNHPYLISKKIPSLRLRITRNGRLIVPVQNEKGTLQSLQFINAQGEKRFLANGKTSGCFCGIAAKNHSKTDPLIIAEGYATAVSIHEATGMGVLVAFSAGNLLAVSKVARNHSATREIILAADYDLPSDAYPGQGGIGLAKAREAAMAIDGFLAIPHLDGRTHCDFNDVACIAGLQKVVQQIAARSRPQAPQIVEGSTGVPDIPSSEILPPPPPVPMEAFPPQLRSLIEETATAFTVPLQIPASVLLVLTACLVGRTRAIQIKHGWYEHGNIWLVLVAPSGMGKTPISSVFFRPVEEMESRCFLEWKEANAAFLLALQEFNKSKSEERGEAPVQPKRVQYYLDESTVEALADALEQNPRGVLWKTDELAGMLADFDKYNPSGKGGGTRARLLSTYDCQSWKSNRRDASRNLHIPAACVSIFGGIQPGMMARTFDGADRDSGFLPRFMFIRAERESPALWNDYSLSPSSESLLRQITSKLSAFTLQILDTGGTAPYVIPLTPEARNAYVHWYDALAKEGWAALNDTASDALCQKLKGQALRLCVLLHSLDAALAGTNGLNPVPEDTMHRALLLADWVKAHQAQTWKMFSTEGKARAGSPIERAIMEALTAEADRLREDGCKLTNARLTSLVNARLPCTASPEQIGKASTALRLPTIWIGKERGRLVPPELLDSFRTTVGPVGTVGKPSGIGAGSLQQVKSHLLEPLENPGDQHAPSYSSNSKKLHLLEEQSLMAVSLPTVPTVPTGYLED